MLGWALTFLIVALIAAVLGFGGIAGFAVEIAKMQPGRAFFVATRALKAFHPPRLFHDGWNRQPT